MSDAATSGERRPLDHGAAGSAPFCLYPHDSGSRCALPLGHKGDHHDIHDHQWGDRRGTESARSKNGR